MSQDFTLFVGTVGEGLSCSQDVDGARLCRPSFAKRLASRSKSFAPRRLRAGRSEKAVQRD